MGAEPLLVVESEKDENGYYIVHYEGQEWALLTYPRRTYTNPSYSDMGGYDHHTMGIEFQMALIGPRPQPKPPKKTWARSMGLRRPK